MEVISKKFCLLCILSRTVFGGDDYVCEAVGDKGGRIKWSTFVTPGQDLLKVDLNESDVYEICKDDFNGLENLRVSIFCGFSST